MRLHDERLASGLSKEPNKPSDVSWVYFQSVLISFKPERFQFIALQF